MGEDLVEAHALKGGGQRDHFADALDGKAVVHIAAGQLLSVFRIETDAEGGGVGLAQLWDIVGDPALREIVAAVFQRLLKILLQHGISSLRYVQADYSIFEQKSILRIPDNRA